MMRSRALLVLVSVAVTACGNAQANGPAKASPTPAASPTPSPSPSPGVSAASLGTPAINVNETVTINFEPATANVKVGDIVQWTNTDPDQQHNVTFRDAYLLPLSSPEMKSGTKWQVKFMVPGTYHYTCTIHVDMDGTVVVTS